MRFPLVTRKTHEAEIARRNDLIKAEYRRATADGNRKVYLWAVEANAALFAVEGSAMYIPRVRATMQHAVNQFNPEKLGEGNA